MKNLTGLISLFVLFSCGKAERLAFTDYVGYVENEKNGLTQVKEIADYKIKVSYQPSEYLALKEATVGDKEPAADKYNNVLTHYKGHYYFHMRIENTGKKNNPLMDQSAGYDEYSYLFQYMSFYGQNDIKLVLGKDTLECVNYHFENNYKLLPFNDIQMAFRKPETLSSDNLTLVWNDQVYGIGRLKIEFEDENINNIPQPIID